MTLNSEEISKKLLQKSPFQFVDKAIDYIPGKSCTCIKAVSINEPYFLGHFPGMPIMPGVLIIESAAQTCSLVMYKQDTLAVPVLAETEDFKFLKPIVPGDVMVIESKLTDRGNNYLYMFDVQVKVNNTICAKGRLTFTYTSEENIYKEKA